MIAQHHLELTTQYAQLEKTVAELKKQLAEQSARKDEVAAEIQTCEEKAVSAFILHVSQLMDDCRLMNEMGIDPTSAVRSRLFPKPNEEGSELLKPYYYIWRLRKDAVPKAC